MGIELMEKVRTNQATIQDLATYYNMDLEDVAEHYATHGAEVALACFNERRIALIDSPEKLIDKLYNMIAYMEELTEHYSRDEDLKYERSTVETILKIFQRLESVIMKSAELQGFVKTPTNTTNIAVIESSVSERIDAILDVVKDSDICTECKIKILNELDLKGLL